MSKVVAETFISVAPEQELCVAVPGNATEQNRKLPGLSARIAQDRAGFLLAGSSVTPVSPDELD
jgi:hypothetical protein